MMCFSIVKWVRLSVFVFRNSSFCVGFELGC